MNYFTFLYYINVIFFFALLSPKGSVLPAILFSKALRGGSGNFDIDQVVF